MKRIQANGLTFAVVDEGEGRPVLLLHGFPDSSRLWRNQVPALVAAGYRVIAPDLRGFGESDKPESVDDYHVLNIAADVLGILDALGVERAHVVGHDWGAVIAWAVAAFAPDRVDRLAALSVGHPGALAERTIEQFEKSWYMLMFQFRGVAEEFLRADDWHRFREFAREARDIEQYVADLSRPGALEAALAWYRANLPPEVWVTPPPEVPAVQASTLGVWSTEDMALTEDQMVRSGKFVTGPWRYERVEGAGHWMQLDQPERVTELLLEHLGEGR